MALIASEAPSCGPWPDIRFAGFFFGLLVSPALKEGNDKLRLGAFFKRKKDGLQPANPYTIAAEYTDNPYTRQESFDGFFEKNEGIARACKPPLRTPSGDRY